MSVMPMDRRWVNEFADALERGDGAVNPAVRPLMSVVETLRPLAEAGPAADPEFKARLRARLLSVATATVDEIPATAPDRAQHPDGRRHASPRLSGQTLAPWRRRFIAAGAGITLAVAAMGGVAASSTNALPGDMLYGVKRTVEDVRVSLARSDESKGLKYLELADTRLGEVERMLRSSGPRPTDPSTVRELDSTLGDLAVATQRGSSLLIRVHERNGDAAPLQSLHEFTRDERARIQAIQPNLPAELRERSASLLALLSQIEAQVNQLLRASSGRDTGTTGPGSVPGPGATTPTPGSGAPGSGGPALPGSVAPRNVVPQAPGGGGGLLPGVEATLRPPGGGGLLPGPGSTPNAGGASVGVSLPPLAPGLTPSVGITIPPPLSGLLGERRPSAVDHSE